MSQDLLRRHHHQIGRTVRDYLDNLKTRSWSSASRPRRRRPAVHPSDGAVIGGLVGVLLASARALRLSRDRCGASPELTSGAEVSTTPRFHQDTGNLTESEVSEDRGFIPRPTVIEHRARSAERTGRNLLIQLVERHREAGREDVRK